MASNTPKLRFNEFTDEWQEKKLGDLFDHSGGTSLENQVVSDGTYKFISIGNYSKDGRYIDNGQRINLGIKTQSKLMNKDEIAMVLNDKTTTGDIIGSSIMIDENDSYIYNQRTERLICKKDILPRYAWIVLNSPKHRKMVFKISQGGTQIYVNYPSVEKLTILLPKINEQEKIAGFLTTVDGKIEELEAKKKAFEKYKKGIMQAIFSHGSTGSPQRKIRFRDSNTKDFPDWEEKKLGEIGIIITGKTPDTSNHGLWFGNIQFITPTDISDDEKYQMNTVRNVADNSNNILPSGSILYTCIASIGKMSISVNPCITNQQINSLVVSGNYSNEFVYYSLLYKTPKIKATQANTTLPIINKTEFSKIKISVPFIEEQYKITGFLTALDNKVDLINNQLEQAKLFKKSLLQRMFV